MPKAPIDRRSLLRGALATGGLFGLDALFTAERTNAAAVGPNDNVKVTKVEAFVLKNSWVFVKISADSGITGWGEMLKDDAKACAAGAQEVARYLVGQDPIALVAVSVCAAQDPGNQKDSPAMLSFCSSSFHLPSLPLRSSVFHDSC